MTRKPVEIEVTNMMFRGVPGSEIPAFAQGLKQSGVVDYLWTYDLLTGWVPASLWTTDSTAAAAAFPDASSFHDPFVMVGIAAATTPGLGVSIHGTNAVSNGPAQLLRALLTISSTTESPVLCAVGAGEQYNLGPFGYKRSEGLRRLEDHFKLYKLLWEAEGPFDFQGAIWSFKKAWIGGTKPANRPKMWAIGGGPKLIEIAAQYADGLMTWLPAHPAGTFETFVKHVRERVESYGRDPDEFGIGLTAALLLHDDEEFIEKAWDNPILRWHGATMACSDMPAYEREGLPALFPPTWSYSLHLRPHDMTPSEVDTIVQKTTPAMVKRFFAATGSPTEAAKRLQEYVDIGATLVAPIDMAPLLLAPDAWEASFARTLEVCSILKGGNRLGEDGSFQP